MDAQTGWSKAAVISHARSLHDTHTKGKGGTDWGCCLRNTHLLNCGICCNIVAFPGLPSILPAPHEAPVQCTFISELCLILPDDVELDFPGVPWTLTMLSCGVTCPLL